jgi:hypothetical protein
VSQSSLSLSRHKTLLTCESRHVKNLVGEIDFSISALRDKSLKSLENPMDVEEDSYKVAWI